IEELAAQYVLGQLDAGEEAEFEARMAASSELRAIVQDLEAGCEALALAAPQVRPPRGTWRRIAASTRRSSRFGIPAGASWLDWVSVVSRRGWAVSVASGRACV